MLKIIYQLLYHPKINHFLIYCIKFLRVVIPERFWLHPTGKLKLTLQNNQYIQLQTNQTSFLTKELFYKGCLSFEYTPYFIKLIAKVDVFFDIGANMGYYSIVGATIQQNLKVHAFEPAEGPNYFLLQNIQLNHLEARITPHQLALSSKLGTATFHLLDNPKYPSIYNLSGEHNLETKTHLRHKKVQVKTSTLDYFVHENNLSKLDLIKIDTEGNEHHILQHGLETILKLKPIIICEVLYNTIENELDELVKQIDYFIYQVKKDGLRLVSSLKRNYDDGVRNCFFVPPSKIHLIEDLLAK